MGWRSRVWKRGAARGGLVSLAAVLWLSACGGGGGGSAEVPVAGGNLPPTSPVVDAPPTSPVVDPVAPTPVVRTSGLVPAAAVPGEVIAEDALTLQPLIDGATWTYDGRKGIVAPGAPTATYVNRATMRRQAEGGYVVDEDNGGNDGPSSTTFVAAEGRWVEQGVIPDLLDGAVQAVRLRSPVRSGDQIVSLDRHDAQGVADIDGDGKAEAVDVAVYTTVVGRERWQVTGLPALDAVRVDVVVRMRVTPSRAGQALPVVEQTLELWLAPGVGVVRQRVLSVHPSGYLLETVEDLRHWDGLDRGFGVNAALTVGLPGERAPSLRFPSVVSNDAGFLVVSSQLDGSWRLAQLDGLGRTQSLGNVGAAEPEWRVQIAAPRAGGVVVVSVSNAFVPTVRWARHGPDLVPVGRPVEFMLPLVERTQTQSGISITVADDVAWLQWSQMFRDEAGAFMNQVLAQPRSLDGTAIGPPIVLTETRNFRPFISGVRMSPSGGGGGVLVEWYQSDDGSSPSRFALARLQPDGRIVRRDIDEAPLPEYLRAFTPDGHLMYQAHDHTADWVWYAVVRWFDADLQDAGGPFELPADATTGHTLAQGPLMLNTSDFDRALAWWPLVVGQSPVSKPARVLAVPDRFDGVTLNRAADRALLWRAEGDGSLQVRIAWLRGDGG